MLSDNENFNQKTQAKVSRINLCHLDDLERLIHQISPFKCSYDVNRVQGFNFDELGYTELFKNAVYLYPQNSEFSQKMAFIAHKSYKGNIKDDRARLLKLMPKIDKYELKSASECNFNSVCFLPGSNCLKDVVMLDDLCKYMYLDSELIIKPHPLTNEKDLKFLSLNFGITRVLRPDVSGFDLLKNANRIYTTSTSEMGLYAKLAGKEVIDITSFNAMSVTAYASMYRFLNYPYQSDDLIKVLSNHLSGVFFYNDCDLKAKIKEYIDTLCELKSLNKNYSNIDYLKRI